MRLYQYLVVALPFLTKYQILQFVICIVISISYWLISCLRMGVARIHEHVYTKANDTILVHMI